ncbi:hypothetical protein ARMSODRAFT_968136 [Armillaria solidipes]|uniref:Uncharacterized protein n=1 Tax=Armillaria solidipes TaxID=1076256 RepID=A0A2H3CP09_9AGAR|nr:hypothetical protein ARMSODRAFT_968136 [Armillaria solidipes]
MSSHVEKHLPLIMPRIEFQLVSSNSLPTITPHINFNYIIQRQQQRDFAPVPSVVEGPTVNLETNALQPPSQPGPSEPPMDPVVTVTTTPAATDTMAPASVVGPAAVLPSDDQVAIPAPALPSAMSIPKTYEQPGGEPGRPRNGGYSLGRKLLEEYGWSKDQYHALRSNMKDWASQYLNCQLCYRKQKDDPRMDMVIRKATVKYGFLKPYPACWPVRALLKCYLKQESYNYRRHGA